MQQGIFLPESTSEAGWKYRHRHLLKKYFDFYLIHRRALFALNQSDIRLIRGKAEYPEQDFTMEMFAQWTANCLADLLFSPGLTKTPNWVCPAKVCPIKNRLYMHACCVCVCVCVQVWSEGPGAAANSRKDHASGRWDLRSFHGNRYRHPVLAVPVSSRLYPNSNTNIWKWLCFGESGEHSVKWVWDGLHSRTSLTQSWLALSLANRT